MELRRVSANDILKSVVGLISPEIHSLGIELKIEMNSEAGYIHVDPQRLRQVFLNLLRNAIEAMNHNGVLTLRTRGPDTAGNILIDVEDTGPGFSEDQPIFDAFYTTKEGGTGLGLAIVHRIVADHGGTIQVASRPGATRFTIVLPQDPTHP